MNRELLTMPLDELTDLVTTWGLPRFRAKQIYEWVHKHHAASFDDMTNLPAAVRAKLAERFSLESVTVFNKQVSSDGTRKYVLALRDDALVETVGMPVFNDDGSIDRLTVCVSSQVGCPMGCTFCATGREGLTRNLTSAEIVAQVSAVQKDFNHRVSNVVVMGQGEPFLNYHEVLQALRLLNNEDDFHIGARHITVSTCGLLDGIDAFAREPEQFTLAVSLHSATQLTRDALMPRVSNQTLPELKKALQNYCRQTKRRVSLEYLLIKDINDSPDDLEALIDFCRGLICHVNLLPMNPVKGALYQPASSRTVQYWLKELESHGIEASLRKSRGSDIAGACGQLKNSL